MYEITLEKEEINFLYFTDSRDVLKRAKTLVIFDLKDEARPDIDMIFGFLYALFAFFVVMSIGPYFGVL